MLGVPWTIYIMLCHDACGVVRQMVPHNNKSSRYDKIVDPLPYNKIVDPSSDDKIVDPSSDDKIITHRQMMLPFD